MFYWVIVHVQNHVIFGLCAIDFSTSEIWYNFWRSKIDRGKAKNYILKNDMFLPSILELRFLRQAKIDQKSTKTHPERAPGARCERFWSILIDFWASDVEGPSFWI